MSSGSCWEGEYFFNPFPPLIVFNTIRIPVTSLTPSISSGDRSRTTLGRARMCTNGIDTKIPTARRRARPLALGVAPESIVGDVPTVLCGLVAMTGIILNHWIRYVVLDVKSGATRTPQGSAIRVQGCGQPPPDKHPDRRSMTTPAGEGPETGSWELYL